MKVVITGCNKGIGFYTAKDLALNPKISIVIWTYRSEGSGKQAEKEMIEKYKVDPKKIDRHPLELSDSDSCKKFHKYVVEKYGKVDVLINNAGIAINKKDEFIEDVTPENAKRMFDVNFKGTMEMCELFCPSMENGGKIINVASMAADVKFTDENLINSYWKAESFEELKVAYDVFVNDVSDGSYKNKGYDLNHQFLGYGITKLLEVVGTRILAKKYDNIIICAISPGFIKTDLSWHNENAMSPENGSQVPIFVLFNATEEYHGGFFKMEDEKYQLTDKIHKVELFK